MRLLALLPALLGSWTHETADGALILTLGADSAFTLTQTGLPAATGQATLEGPTGGPWRLSLLPDDGRAPPPPYRLRALDAGHVGLSGGALTFEVVLERR